MLRAWPQNVRSRWLGISAAAMLAGCGPAENTARVSFVGWGFVQSNIDTTTITATNNVRVLEYFDPDSESFAYLTGAEFGVVDDDALRQAMRMTAIPHEVIAVQEVGGAVVNVFADETETASEYTELARLTAEALHLATTEIWPREPTEVVVDVFVMPDDEVFSLGRRVDWQAGDPFHIAMFPMTSNHWPEIATHELYHILTARWSTGAKGPERDTLPNAASAFEEVAAAMFASCSVLLAEGEINPTLQTLTAEINERAVDPAASDDDLAYVLEVVRNADLRREASGPGTLLGKILERVPLDFYLGYDDRLTLQSDRGRSFLSLCRNIAPDPMQLGSWLDGIVAAPFRGPPR